ncbi:MAG: Penicillin amidase [Frankiales bacterium]|nr:Penicillin amidase [Frankiales bacterium]
MSDASVPPIVPPWAGIGLLTPKMRPVTSRLPAAALALALVVAAAWPGAAADVPAFVTDGGGFHSVLAYGQGQTANLVDLARHQVDGSVPPSFTSQGPLYDKVITSQPTGDLSGYYKDSDFAKISGTAQSPVAGATIVRDSTYRVPHIYGDTRDAAMYAVGYATAQDRLFLMDVLRRTAEGSTAELLGPSALPADSAALGQFDLSPAELTAEVMRLPQDEGAAGARGLKDLQQYVAGINAWIAKTRLDPTLLPAEYPALGATPREWTLADTAAEAYLLIAQFTVFGDAEHLQSDVLARLQNKLGAVRGRQVYDDLRHLEDPQAPVTADRQFPSDRPAMGPSSAARLDAASITPRDAVATTTSPSLGLATGFPTWATTLATRGLQLKHDASNALLVGAAHSTTGRALAAMGPQVGYYSPEILVEYELHAPGVHVSGMSFPGASPFPLIGHTTSFAWSGTTANGDNADTFAEQLCDPAGGTPTRNSDHYLYKGRCIAFTHREQVLHTPLSPTTPTTLPETVTLRTMRSVHGPVHDFATVAGKPFALVRATAVNHHGIRGLVAFLRLAEGQVHTPQDFVATMRHYTGNENWFYVSSKHIAWLQSGWFPQHAPGTDLEQPIRGTGPWDWKGFTPASSDFTRHDDAFNPTAIDPEQGYLASWNNRGAPQWRAAPGIWSYGRVHRDELLRDPTVAALQAGRTLTLPEVVGISGNASTQDLRGVEVLPDLLEALGPVTDPTEAGLATALRTWMAKGAHRRDTRHSGYDDDSAAVLLFDAWWRQVVHDIYDPQLGADIVTLLQGGMDLVLDGRAVQTNFYDGWYGQVSDVVRAALGTGPKPSATTCGGGGLAGCRALLRTALTTAVATVQASQGTDPASWRKPVLCPDDASPTCDENRPLTAGAIATPAHPFENRGTFHQAVEVLTDLDPAPASASVTQPQAAGVSLPATGGTPLAAELGLLLLGVAAVARPNLTRG